MAKYAVKIQQPNVDASNYAIMTFTNQAVNGAERCAALVIALQASGVMSTSRILDITRSDGPGPGTLVVPSVEATQEALDEIQAGGLAIGTITGNVLGVDRGSEAGQAPLGISILVTETAVSGPKGRCYIPYVASGGQNTDTGRPTAIATGLAKLCFEAAYGLEIGLDGLPVPGRPDPSFYVTSGGASPTQSLIVGVNVSQSYAYLRSRAR